VDDTVALIATQCAPGSTLVLDYFTDGLVSGKLCAPVAAVLRRAGEPLLCPIGRADDEDAADKWASAHGLKLRTCLRGGEKGKRWGGVLAADVVAPSQ
jgi:hypothetical protein